MKSWAFDLYRDTRCVNWKDLDMWAFLCKFDPDWLKKRSVGAHWRDQILTWLANVKVWKTDTFACIRVRVYVKQRELCSAMFSLHMLTDHFPFQWLCHMHPEFIMILIFSNAVDPENNLLET